MFSSSSLQILTSDGCAFGQLSCKRRNGDKSLCHGVLTCLGNESTPMKTPELARQRASQIKHASLGHGYRLSCSICGDKPPSKTNPLKLRSWQEWCEVCREVWCNQSFHSKHGGIAKKGGEKKFSGRVKDHKKRLWAIYVALWLVSKTNNAMQWQTWLRSPSGLSSVLSSRVSPEEKIRVQNFVMREIATIQRYLTQSSSSHSNKTMSSSSQTWPPVKRARTVAKSMNVEQCVLRRLPIELSHERNWLLNMVRKLKCHNEAPVALRVALSSMVDDPPIPVAGGEDSESECVSKGECGDVGVVGKLQALSFTSPYKQYPPMPRVVPAVSVIRQSHGVGIPHKAHIPMHVISTPSHQTWPPIRKKRERSPSFQNIPRQNSAEDAAAAASALMMMTTTTTTPTTTTTTSSSSSTWSSGQV